MTERQDRLLAERDGRYFGIDKLGADLVFFAKAELLGKRNVVHFGLPSGPALFLSQARRAFEKVALVDPRTMFLEVPYGRAPTNQSTLFDYFEYFMSHVVFSFTALEAFANGAIPPAYTYETTRKEKVVRLAKSDIERSISLDEKLDRVLPGALGVASPKGKKLWDRYRRIKTMRDRVIHLKTADYTASGPESESVWGMMLRSHGEAFCDHAHAVMGHYTPAVNRRWFREYPFGVVERDGLNQSTGDGGSLV